MPKLPFQEFKNKIINTLPLQAFVFSIVGIICFIIDASLLILFIDYFNLSVVLATAIAFIIANIINYYLSIFFVFLNGKFSIKYEIGGFFFLAFIGLFINIILMYFFVDVLNKPYLVSKIVISLLLMGFNFYTRKKILFIK